MNILLIILKTANIDIIPRDESRITPHRSEIFLSRLEINSVDYRLDKDPYLKSLNIISLLHKNFGILI